MTREKLLVGLAALGVAFVTAFLVFWQFDQRGGGDIVIQGDPSTAEIAVWVDGAVATPGVYRLADGARLADAVAAAGGFREDTDLGRLNLAARLTDEQHIVIPGRSVAAVASPEPGTGIVVSSGVEKQTIDINHADAATLDTLPGIGPVLAGRIVSYREANGPFARVEELARVDGISPGMVDDLRNLITVGP
jgi:competence protein ComEA